MSEDCVPVELIAPKKSGPGLFMGILMGGLIGAGVALLTAPRSGMETRQFIRDKGVHLKDQAVSTVSEARSRAEGAIRTSADKASQVRQRGQSTLQDKTSIVQNRVQSIVEGVKEGVRTYSEGDSAGDQVHEMTQPTFRPVTPHMRDNSSSENSTP